MTTRNTSAKSQQRQMLLWIGALVIGVALGLPAIGWIDEVMNFIAGVYTRLFQLLAVPTIVLAVITTLASLGAQSDSGRIFRTALKYTVLTTVSAAAVGLLLYIIMAPGNLPEGIVGTSSGLSEISEYSQMSYEEHFLFVVPNNIVRPFLEGNVLSLILIAFAVGMALAKMKRTEGVEIVVKGLQGLQELLFKLIHWLIWTLPLGILAFAEQLAAQVSAGVAVDSLGKFFLTLSLMTGIGAPVAIMGIILPVYTIIDMIETAENVWSDSCVAAMTDHDL